MRSSLLISILIVAAACGPGGEPLQAETESSAQAVRGGTLASGDPAVVAFAVRGDGYWENFCTGTLVGAKTVVTAAHCINSYGRGNYYYVLFGSDADAPTKYIHVTSQYANAKYTGDAYDFGVVQLDEVATGVTPIELNTTALTRADVGRPIRHVGFGTTNGRTGSGYKREVTYNVRSITSRLIESGATGKQTCGGDSGGPGFMTFPGSPVEKLAGVISFGDPDCLEDGWDGRVDIEAAWMNQVMSAWEVPTCNVDNKCLPGCTPIDPDCACVSDGRCTAECTRPERDVDCPANCGADGVCSTAACPIPDADCVREGDRCTGATQCRTRLCVSDPQHPATYCSAGCGGDSECPQGMACNGSVCILPQLPERAPGETCTEEDFCTQQRICNGPAGGIRRCVTACTTTSDCGDPSSLCEGGSTGQRYCRPPASVMSFELPVLPKAPEEFPAVACSSAQGVQSLAVLAIAALLRRRRSGRR